MGIKSWLSQTMNTCPICKRDRHIVAQNTTGFQVALGKKTSCVECGPKILKRRDQRARIRQTTIINYNQQLMKRTQQLLQDNYKLTKQLEKLTQIQNLLDTYVEIKNAS